MNVERYSTVKRHFLSALDQPADRRAAYVASVAADSAMRAEIMKLLSEMEAETGLDLGPMSDATYVPSSATHTADEPPPRSVIGPYKIVRTIGRGGMGAVYLAEQSSPKRNVALKVVRAALHGTQAIERFKLEAEILGRLEHEGIARIFESSAPAGEDPYIAMEYVEGVPLNEYVAAHGRDVRAVFLLLEKVAAAVAHAHQRGIIHRDLKPGNILVTKDATPKVLDFGISRLVEAERVDGFATETGQILGTLAYMSPEQASGKSADVDTRSDVYSLGVIAYELLTGKIPCDVPRAAFAETLQAIRETAPMPLERLVHGIDPDAAVIVHHALEKERERRYSSAADLAADIGRYLRHEPIVARPASAAYHLKKFVRRHRVLVAGVVATFVALTGGIVATTIARRQAVEARGRAENDRDAANAAKIEAQARLDEARAMQRFLEIVVLSARGEQMGPKVTVVDALEFADDQIQREFGKSPRIEAAVHLVLGRTRMSLGDYAKSKAEIDAALALREKILPPGDPLITDAHGFLGQVHYFMGALADAERELTRCVDIRRRALPADPDLFARDVHYLANTLTALGRKQEAKTLYEETIRAYETRGVDCAKNLGVTLSAYAVCLHDLALIEPSIKANRRALEIFNAIDEIDGVDAATTMRNLSQVLMIAKQPDEAEALLRRAIAIMEGIVGRNHPKSAGFRAHLAQVLVSTGRANEAKTIAEEVLAVQESRGEGHRLNVAEAKIGLAEVRRALGDVEGQIESIQSAITDYQATIGPTAEQTVRVRFLLARTFAEAQRFEDSFAEIEALYDIAKKTREAADPLRAQIAIEYGMNFMAKEDWVNSEKFMLEGLDVLTKLLDAGNVELRAQVIDVLRGLGNVAHELNDEKRAADYAQRLERVISK